MSTVYTKTATKARSGKIYAFGRHEDYEGKDKHEGGYILYVIKVNYCGQRHGGLDKHWAAVKCNLSFEDAMELMNKKCGYKAFG